MATDLQSAALAEIEGMSPALYEEWEQWWVAFEREHGDQSGQAMYAAVVAFKSVRDNTGKVFPGDDPPTYKPVPGPDNLYPQAYGTFMDGQGAVVHRVGGSYYPAHLQVKLDRRRALSIIQTLASQLLYPDTEVAVEFSGVYLDQHGDE